MEISEGMLYAGMLTGTIGAGFLLYGIRQKEPVTLVIGVLLNVLPFVLEDAWAMLGLSTVVVVGGLWLKKQM